MKGALSALFGSGTTADRGRGREKPQDSRHAADRAGTTDGRRTPVARPAIGVAGDGRGSTKHVVDDARVAGGVAVNINARPRRRVAGHLNAESYGIPCLLCS